MITVKSMSKNGCGSTKCEQQAKVCQWSRGSGKQGLEMSSLQKMMYIGLTFAGPFQKPHRYYLILTANAGACVLQRFCHSVAVSLSAEELPVRSTIHLQPRPSAKKMPRLQGSGRRAHGAVGSGAFRAYGLGQEVWLGDQSTS